MRKTPTRIAGEYAEAARRIRETALVLNHELKRFAKVSEGYYQSRCRWCPVFIDLYLDPDQAWQSSGGLLSGPCRGRMGV
jgi:hypothetical protein